MKTHGVFFDLYGTLIVYGDMETAWNAWFEVFYGVFEKAGLQMSPTDFRPYCQDLFERPEPPKEKTNHSVVERRLHDLARSFGLMIPPDRAREGIEASIDVWHNYVWLDPEAKNILKEIKETRAVALVSNFDYSPYVFRMLERLDLRQLFDAVVVSDAVGYRKPDPAIFQHALNRIGLSPEKSIHVGDSPEDVQGAQAAGIRPVLICRKKQDEAEDQKHPGVTRINALNQLRQLLD